MNLKRLYKEKKDLQNKSGGEPVKWVYLEVMHELFHKERWVKPLSVAGNGISEKMVVDVATSRPKQDKPAHLYLEELTVEKHLKQEADALEHHGKISRMDRFNDCLESMAGNFAVIAAVKKAKIDNDNRLI